MKRETKIFNKIAAILLTMAMAFGTFVMPDFTQTASAEGAPALPVVSNVDEGANVGAVYSQRLDLGKESLGKAHDAKGYFSFVLNSDSWVHFTGSYSLCENDGVGTDVKIYSDPNYSNSAIEYGFGYYRYGDKEEYKFLKKGTYYGYAYTEHENYDSFTGNVNIVGYAIPVSTIFKAKMKKKKGKTVVTINDALGKYGRGMQYINKSVGKNSINNNSIWKIMAFGKWLGGSKKTKVMNVNANEQLTFKAKKSGKYTLMVEDTAGNRYSKIIKVKVKGK